MKEMKIEYKGIDELIPYENNPRINEHAVDYVAKSIEEFGFKNPIIIDKKNVIIAGHTRLKAAEKLGIEKVPTIMAAENKKIIICQSNAKNEDIREDYNTTDYDVIINPLGEWTGGINVDAGATNRKLGSDMADSVTGGGLHGKDLSKADVSVNIYAFRKAQETGKEVKLCCAIGDETIDGKPYSEIVEEARKYINSKGGFEKFAEWGLF